MSNVIKFPVSPAMAAQLEIRKEEVRDIYYGLIESGEIIAADAVADVLNALCIEVEGVSAE